MNKKTLAQTIEAEFGRMKPFLVKMYPKTIK